MRFQRLLHVACGVAIALFAGCTPRLRTTQTQDASLLPPAPQPAPIGSPSDLSTPLPTPIPTPFATPHCEDTSTPFNHERFHAVLWMQRSAEYKANTLQTFAVATQNLARALADPSAWPPAVAPDPSEPPGSFAVIVDVDETLVDNSPEEVSFMAYQHRKFDVPLWNTWEMLGKAEAIKGAKEFLDAADNKGVKVFYVTNRTDAYKSDLARNLEDLQFPMPLGKDSLLLPKDCTTPDKECRRKLVAKSHRVLLSVGDDFGDFMNVSGKPADERVALALANRDRWGREWIILPNPSYGSWDRAFYSAQDPGTTILYKKCRELRPPAP